MSTLGFVGLGAMGSGMVARLLKARRAVVGYNRTRVKAQPLIDAGMQWRDTPRAVAEAADVIFTMVADTRALAAVTEGSDGILAGLRPGQVYIDMSTISPAASRDLAARVAERGARMLDAPVSGSTVTLREGKLSFMVGGDKATCAAVTPILLDIGPKVTYVGGNGQGALMKVATNLNLAVQMLAFSEGILLAEKGGIPRPLAAEVLLNSAIASPMLRYRGPFVLRDPDEVLFTVNMMQKDMLLALEAGRALNVPLPTTAVANEFLTAARGLGLEHKDFAAVCEALARLSGSPR
ncbi:MAG TPA: NAD(P)-dependent oxidoreductase [bacterium]|nr:NAD(P)-dependent oxidoreductase [bacterium]